ncbi:alpha-L-rhamnosidase C-terminal domain-containing protein [Arthrobacter pascens]|nr:alpha-L-rhamnosidase C-terminal domain-containing protein [Arthrobacter pascens]
MTSASPRHETPYGTASISWRSTGTGYSQNIKVPEATATRSGRS